MPGVGPAPGGAVVMKDVGTSSLERLTAAG
jgi:hypothetical protein